jgi:hypothetical protein
MWDNFLAFVLYIITLSVFVKGDYFYFIFRYCSLINKIINIFLLKSCFNFLFFDLNFKIFLRKIPNIISVKNFYELFFSRFLIQRKKFIKVSHYLWFLILAQGIIILSFNFINLVLKIYFEELDFKNFDVVYKYSAYSFILVQFLFIVFLFFGKLGLKWFFVISSIYETMLKANNYSLNSDKLKDEFYEKNSIV